MNTLNSLFDWVLGAGLRASLLVLAVLAVQWLLKSRLPSRWRYALWLPVLVALLVPSLPILPVWMNWPAGSLSAEVLQQATPSASANTVRTAVVLPESVERAEIPPMRTRIIETISVAAARVQPAAAAKPLNWRAWLMSAWLIGTAGVSLFVLTSFALTMWRIRRKLRPVETELHARIAHAAKAVGLRRTPRVLKSSAVATPTVCGSWRPTLLLNERFPQDLSAEEADMVLRHELTHIRRGDLVLNGLLCALLALHWFNPLLWLAFFRVRADREAACDAQVLDGEPAPRRAAYGHTLLKMETAFPPTGLCLGFVGILQRGGTLRERIHAIISQPELNHTMKITIALSIALLTIAGIAKASEANGQEALDANREATLGAILDSLKRSDAGALSAKLPGLTREEAGAVLQRISKQWGDLSKLTATTEKLPDRFNKGNMGVVEHWGNEATVFGRWLDLRSNAVPSRWLRLGVLFAKGDSKPRQFMAVEWKEKPAAAPKPTVNTNELAVLKDGEYTLKVTHGADDPQVQFPSSPIPEAAYKPVNGALTLQLRFTAKGKKEATDVRQRPARTRAIASKLQRKH